MTDEVEVHEIGMPDFASMFQRDDPPELDPETARELLKDAIAVLDAHTDFKRGDIIRQKKGLGASDKGLRGGIGIFITYGAPPMEAAEPMSIGLPVALHHMDCIIGLLGDEGAMREHFACSRYYELA